jgi:NO-binding membrane sensor protein with MHYT domain
VVASILVSLLGSYATLTLLGRRTGSHGWRNHAILGLSVVCFATVAVWGMHFVSTKAASFCGLSYLTRNFAIGCVGPSQVSFQGFILRPSPHYKWYLEFSPGFTAMSLFVPLVACWVAFYYLGDQDELHIWRIIVAGVSCGGMSMSMDRPVARYAI